MNADILQAKLLQVKDLTVDIYADDGFNRVVHPVNFTLGKGQSLGIVGESGSGKTMTANAIMGILPDVALARGEVSFNGKNLLELPPAERRAMSGPGIAYIFQEPMSALHPTLSIAAQMIKPMRVHLGLNAKQARERAAELLHDVGIPPNRNVLKSYVHQLSGGMRQRVMIAMSIACNPQLLIADEPTTALDSTVQKQILDLLMRLCQERDMALILISHDLGLVSQYTDNALVMLEGHQMEYGTTRQLVNNPQNDYTKGLLAAAPRIGNHVHRLPVIDKTAILARGNQ